MSPDATSPDLSGPESGQNWRRHRRRHTLTSRLCRGLLRLAGWRLSPDWPALRGGAVLVGGPHTSNFDLPVFLLGVYGGGIRPSFMIKREALRGPGALLKLIGAVGVDRRNPGRLVASLLPALRSGAALGVMPKGTRGPGHWKSGFLHLSRGSGAPLYAITADYARKELRLQGPHYVGPGEAGQAAAMAWARAAFAGVQGRHPQFNDDVRLSSELSPAAPEATAPEAAAPEVTAPEATQDKQADKGAD